MDPFGLDNPVFPLGKFFKAMEMKLSSIILHNKMQSAPPWIDSEVMRELIQQPQSQPSENGPVTEANYKKAIKRLARLEKVKLVTKFICLSKLNLAKRLFTR